MKYLRATLYITWCSAMGWPLICMFSKMGMLYAQNSFGMAVVVIVAMMGNLIEPCTKMGTYVGFYLPKLTEIIYKVVFLSRGR